MGFGLANPIFRRIFLDFFSLTRTLFNLADLKGTFSRASRNDS